MQLDNKVIGHQSDSPGILPSGAPDSAFRFHRHQLFILDRVQNPSNSFCLPASGRSVLQDWLNLERLWRVKKATPTEIEHSLSIVSNEFQRSAILRGLIRNPSVTLPLQLLDWISDHSLNNSLIIELFKQNLHTLPNLHSLANRLISLLQNPQNSPQRTTALLILAALHPELALPHSLLTSLFNRYHASPSVAFGLLEYLVSHQNPNFLVQWVEKTLQQSDFPFPLNLAVWLSLRKLQPSLFAHYFQALDELEPKKPGSISHLKVYLKELILFNQKLKNAQKDNHGITIAQFMFHGSIDQPGVGDSGGLSIFLTQLGNALVENQNIERVITFVTVPAASDFGMPLVSGDHGHLRVNLPIHDSRWIAPDDYLSHPLQIKTLLRLILREFNPLPDAFHLRFNDIQTRTVAEIAQEMNFKTILTLTADPHRALEKQLELHSPLNYEDNHTLNLAVSRVLIADQLLQQAASVVILPSRMGIADLLPYFPQLPQLIRQKPFAVIPEGIEIEPPAIADQKELQPILTKIKRSKEDSSHSHRRLILNVGRLSPIKQQNLLVKAWLNSGLWKSIDLILIGGSPVNPTPTEEKMLRSINSLLEKNPEARSNFFLLPALPNQQIRALETYLAENYPLNQPPLYVCSSLKEEFGIAILEAMSAGWMAVGPQAGGLSSYIRDGENGFLMDTSQSANIEQVLMEILAKDEEILQAIAARGAQTIHQNYDIRRISQLLADLYIKTLSFAIPKTFHENHPDYQPAVLLSL
jgi:D-inositol-3-phosphate glycosyltransferase